ncbi:hypothetical protein [Actinoplanes sp. L3-i22]|uniref:hypothetical protein n=1 Tax=Actinoplanes sp. L3-i22 TaxID=2836373 RepID=UPI001C845C27|nr:hypothetical protein [Actinoplanes sp. L3-i22]
MSEVVIELGEVRDAPEVREPVTSRHFRIPLLGLVLLLAALPGGAATRARPAPPVTVPAAIGDRVQSRADRLYVIGAGVPVGSPVTTQTVRAYTLPAVHPLFEQSVRVSGEIVDVQAAAGDDLLLVQVRGYTDAGQTTIAVRPGVAEPLWTLPGALAGVLPGGTAVFGSRVVGAADTDTGLDWRGVDLATGAIRWTIRQQPGEQAALDTDRGAPRWLYLLREERLTAYDTRDGRPVAEVALPGMRPRSAVLWPLTGRLLVSSDATGSTIFDTGSGLRAAAHVGNSLTGYTAADDCQELICAYNHEGSLAGLDPRTLAERWSVVGEAYTTWLDGYLLTFDPFAVRPVIRRSDPVTGQETGRVTGWQFAPGPGSEVYLRRGVGKREWFGRLEPARMWVRPLIAVENVTDECQVTGEVLICRKIDGSVGVWRLR